MTGISAAIGRRTPGSLRLTVPVIVAFSLLAFIALGMVAGDVHGITLLIAGLAAALVSIVAGARPALAGLPLLVLIIASNASDLLSRMLSIPSVLQGLAALLLLVLVAKRSEMKPERALRHPMTLGFAAFVGVIFVTSLWATVPALADHRASELVRALVLFVIVAALAGSSARAFRRGISVFVLTMASLSLLSLFQVATGRYDLQFGRFAAVQFGHLFAQTREARIAGPVDDPNFYAQILLLAIPPAIGLCAVAATRLRRLTFALAALAIMAALMLTYSRGAMLAFAVTVVLFPFFVPVRRFILPALTVFLLGALVLAPTDLGRRLATIQSSVAPASGVERDSSVAKRKLLLGSAWQMFLDHPVGGVGAGNFDEHYRTYARVLGSSAPQYDDPGETQYPHSLPAELASETGAVGLLSFVGVIILGIVTSRRASRELRILDRHGDAFLAGTLALSMIGYLVASLFLHSAFQRYLWLVMAFIVAADLLTRAAASTTEAPR